MDNTKNNVTRYLKNGEEAFLTTKSHAYEVTFIMPDGMKYTSEFPFEDYGSKSKALSAAKMELSSYGFYKARRQDQIKKEPRLLSRTEVNQNLFALESLLSSVCDSFVLPDDVKCSMLDLIELVDSKLGLNEAYDVDVSPKLFVEVYED